MNKTKKKKQFIICNIKNEEEDKKNIISPFIKDYDENKLRNKIESLNDSEYKKIIEINANEKTVSIENNYDDKSLLSITSFNSDSYTYYSSDYYTCSNSIINSDESNLHLTNLSKTKEKDSYENYLTLSDKSSIYSKSCSYEFSENSLFFVSNQNLQEEKTNYKEQLLFKENIKIFSLNCYLYNDIYRYNPHLYGFYEKCRNNKYRTEQIAMLSSQYDLIFLRSVYGRYQKILYDRLKDTHTILLDSCPMSNINFFNEFIYFFQNYLYGNGGLFICWKKEIFKLKYYDLIYLSSDILLKRKVIKIIKLIYKKKYNIYFIHCEFDLYSSNNKMSNIDDLIMLIKKTLWKIYIFQLFYKNRKKLKIKEDNENEINILNQLNENDEYINENNMNKQKETELNDILNDDISKLIFKNTSMLIIGSFNIDRNENKELYQKLITLNNLGVLKDMFFYKNINYKIQKTYNIVERENTFVGGLNYSFGLTDNIFLLDSFFLNSESINELINLYNPIDVIIEKLKKLNKDYNKFNLHKFIQFINKKGILFKFQYLFNLGVDILTQKKNKELSDHWILSGKFFVNINKLSFDIEKYLQNYIINVEKYFYLHKTNYDILCEVDDILKKKKINNVYKADDLNIQKYNYFKKCIITKDNIHNIHFIDSTFGEILKKCFGIM